MKKIIILSIITLFGWIQNANSQSLKSINYIMVLDTATACENELIIYGYTGNYGEPNGIISVDWGDGTSSLYPFSVGPNSYFGTTATHTYSNADIYTTATRVYSGTSDAWMDTIVYYQLTVDPAACGAIRITTKFTGPPNYKFRDAPVDFTDVNGKITTIVPHLQGQPVYYNYQGLNPSKFPYTATLNPTWLHDHGLTQTTPPLTITYFNGTGLAIPSTYQFITACAPDTNTVPDIKLENPMAYYFNHTNQKGFLHFDIRNLNCSNPVNATVSVDFPSGCLPVMTGLTNPSISGHTLTFDVNNVRSYSDSSSRTIPFNFMASIPSGTQLCFDISISTDNEINLVDNSGTVCSVISNTINPINKLVNLTPIIDSQKVETLTYKINFQNNDNDHWNLIHLKIIDTLSENLDLSTFKVISSSHGVCTNIDQSTRVVTFTFHDAGIVSSIYGAGTNWDELEIVYSVSEKAGLIGGDAIHNTAYIYSNYKPVITTNTTQNVNQMPLTLMEQNMDNPFLFPNPAQDKLYFGGTIIEIYIYDTAGKLVLEATNIQGNEVSLSGLQSGFYQVVLKTENGISIQKLVIKK